MKTAACCLKYTSMTAFSLKKILILARVLALSLAVFASCAKEEKPTDRTISVYNRSGGTLSVVTVAAAGGTSSTTYRNVADNTDQQVVVTVKGDEQVSITVTSGDNVTGTFPVPSDVSAVTVLAGPNVSYSAPEK